MPDRDDIREAAEGIAVDPPRIWLQNAEDAKAAREGRMWCKDKVWPDDPEDGEPVEYIRLDLHESALRAERARGMEEAGEWLPIDDRARDGMKWELVAEDIYDRSRRIVTIGYYDPKGRGYWFGGGLSSHWQPIFYRAIPAPPAIRAKQKETGA